MDFKGDQRVKEGKGYLDPEFPRDKQEHLAKCSVWLLLTAWGMGDEMVASFIYFHSEVFVVECGSSNSGPRSR